MPHRPQQQNPNSFLLRFTFGISGLQTLATDSLTFRLAVSHPTKSLVPSVSSAPNPPAAPSHLSHEPVMVSLLSTALNHQLPPLASRNATMSTHSWCNRHKCRQKPLSIDLFCWRHRTTASNHHCSHLLNSFFSSILRHYLSCTSIK
ncbi:uncharacterized protein LOC130797279 [Amaranthus tricolor]|uniref:uncharacterized protein LOC130797279 n=1 Tax=Amaranthus tricolor TaxID=29722 RepID=UPI002582629D|nr:uncharacterized protein LOC130797279 [Amaranthus tricolor]